MKFILITLSLITLSAQAAQIKVQNADDWKVQFIPKNTQESVLLGGADFTLTFAVHKAGAIPTVLVNKLQRTSGSPRNASEWRELILKDKPELRPTRERVLVRDGSTRYVAEFEKTFAAEVTTKYMIMATVVEGEIYVFSYQGHLPIFRAHFDDIVKLYKTVSLDLE